MSSMATNESSIELKSKKRRREASLYDAVAGRVQVRGFLTSNVYTSSTRDTAVGSRQPVPPEEVLFRRKQAPQRYEEDDMYFQDRFLPNEGRELPSSDLLTALHAYASDFYGGLQRRGTHCERDWASLDETALLAMGILLEEQCKHELGETGHLALLEEVDEEDAEGLVWNGRTWVRSVIRHPRDRTDTKGDEGTSDGSSLSTTSDDSDSESADAEEPGVEEPRMVPR